MALSPEYFWEAVSIIASPYVFLALSAFLLAAQHVFRSSPERKTLLRAVALSIILTFLLTAGIKEAAKIPRSCIPCGVGVGECNPYCSPDYSFPSGHASVSAAAFASLILASGKRRLFLLSIFPAIVSFSRLALGVHTPADIAGGIALGVAVSFVSLRLSRNAKYR